MAVASCSVCGTLPAWISARKLAKGDETGEMSSLERRWDLEAIEFICLQDEAGERVCE